MKFHHEKYHIRPEFSIGQPVFFPCTFLHGRVVHLYKEFSQWLGEDVWVCSVMNQHGDTLDIAEHFLEHVTYNRNQTLKVVK